MSKHTRTPSEDYRWNFAVLIADMAFYMVGMAFVNTSSIMPALVRQLTQSAPVVGMVNTVFMGFWMFPQLLIANLIGHKPLKKPYLMMGTAARVMFLLIAVALWSGLPRDTGVLLITFFVALSLFAIGSGVTSVAWLDIMPRAIPARRRGRLIGTAQVLSGLAGIGVGILVSMILGNPRLSFPANYALLFALASGFMLFSTSALALIREPNPQSTAAQHPQGLNSGWQTILKSDRDFRHLILCRILVGMSGLAVPFYVGHAEDVLHLPISIIGAFVTAQTLGGVVSSAILSPISERHGTLAVARIGSAVTTLAPVFAIVAHLTGNSLLIHAYPLIYATLGVTNNIGFLGFSNYLLEIAPDELRPTYVGLSNTILGATMIVPTLGGWLLEATSYTVLFGITAIAVLAGYLLTLRLPDPQCLKEAGGASQLLAHEHV